MKHQLVLSLDDLTITSLNEEEEDKYLSESILREKIKEIIMQELCSMKKKESEKIKYG